MTAGIESPAHPVKSAPGTRETGAAMPADSAAAQPTLGRPSLFTEALATEIVERLSNGEPLAVICRDEHMPASRTVSDWKRAHPDFSTEFARARAEGFDAIAAECLEIADDGSADYRLSTRDGSSEMVVDQEHIQRSKLRIETRLKLLAKWDPKRYGDKLALTGGSEDDAPIRTVRRIERVIVDPKD